MWLPGDMIFLFCSPFWVVGFFLRALLLGRHPGLLNFFFFLFYSVETDRHPASPMVQGRRFLPSLADFPSGPICRYHMVESGSQSSHAGGDFGPRRECAGKIKPAGLHTPQLEFLAGVSLLDEVVESQPSSKIQKLLRSSCGVAGLGGHSARDLAVPKARPPRCGGH